MLSFRKGAGKLEEGEMGKKKKRNNFESFHFVFLQHSSSEMSSQLENVCPENGLL